MFTFPKLRHERPAEQGRVELVTVIQDTGIGMTPEFMEQMYAQFTRAVDTRVNKVRGTGLGLAIVKKIVDLMDGRIEVQSAPQQGTTFTVRLTLPVPTGLPPDPASSRWNCLIGRSPCWWRRTMT